ncbi:MAG: aminoacyl-tRNA hydrolase, partial [Clostridiales bacterium]|nr:aminoacyl-tRNA hydrolase [Clostridiales bacterium]
SHLGHDTFLRIKMGVGEKPAHYDLADYVLGHFTQAERKVMNESTQSAIKAIELMVMGQSDKAMNDYNKKASEQS